MSRVMFSHNSARPKPDAVQDLFSEMVGKVRVVEAMSYCCSIRKVRCL